MSYDNSGLLFKAKEKKSEKSPDYEGKMTLGGKEYRISGWKKEGKNGPYISLSLKLKEPTPATQEAPF